MSKVGRNDPCPCGSGKKYKKCCENKAKSFKAEDLTHQKGSFNLTSFFQDSIAPMSTIPPEEEEVSEETSEEKTPPINETEAESS